MTPHPTVADLRRRYHGAPDSLRTALRRLADASSLPRVTRREYARALGALEPPPLPRVGVVPFVVVVPGQAEGCVYRAVASDGGRADLAALPHDLTERVRAWLDATFPDLSFAGLHLAVSGPPPGPTWSGRSCELALAAAALSWALGVPVPRGLVVSGTVGEPGRTGEARHLDDKRAVVARDLPGALLVAPGSTDAVELLDRMVPGWQAARRARAGRAPSTWAREASDALEAGRLDAALDLADRALAATDDPAAHARASWVRGSALLHLGRADEGLAALEAAAARLPSWEDHADDPAEDLVEEELEAHVLVALIDTGRARAAFERGEAILARLARAEARTRRWRAVALQVAGSTHRAAVALGMLGPALALLETWSLGRARLADQLARALGDAAEVHRRAGRLPDARRLLVEARAALPDAPDPTGTTARFLTLFEARLDADLLRPVAPARAGGPLWPELGFRLLGTRSDGESLRDLHQLPPVRASRVLQGVVAAETAWHALHELPDADVLDLVRQDIATWEVDDPGLAALHARIVEAPQREDLVELRRRAPYG